MGDAEHVRRLQRFLSPQVRRFILSCDDQQLLQSQCREVTVVFCDLRGFTSFVESAPLEDVMMVLRTYHQVLGRLTAHFNGTLERFTGDGIMVYFDEPPVAEQAARAVRMSIHMRSGVRELCRRWRRRGYELDVGIGIALGLASVGTVGFEGRYDYAAIGPVTNLGSRLCAHAAPGQILISQRAYTAVQHLVDAEPVEALPLRGFRSRTVAYDVRDLKPEAVDGFAVLESSGVDGYDTVCRG
jgi:adenylate cyclase